MKVKCYLKTAGGALNDQRVIYPSVIDAGRISSEALVDLVASNCSLTRGTVLAVVSGVVSELLAMLELGHSVEVDGLGVFSLKVKGKVVSDDKGRLAINNPRGTIAFRPRQAITDTLDNARYMLVSQRVRPNVTLTDDEALAVAERQIDHNGLTTVSLFADETGASRSYADKVLHQLVARGKLKGDKHGRLWVFRKPQANGIIPNFRL